MRPQPTISGFVPATARAQPGLRLAPTGCAIKGFSSVPRGLKSPRVFGRLRSRIEFDTASRVREARRRRDSGRSEGRVPRTSLIILTSAAAPRALLGLRYAGVGRAFGFWRLSLARCARRDYNQYKSGGACVKKVPSARSTRRFDHTGQVQGWRAPEGRLDRGHVELNPAAQTPKANNRRKRRKCQWSHRTSVAFIWSG